MGDGWEWGGRGGGRGRGRYGMNVGGRWGLGRDGGGSWERRGWEKKVFIYISEVLFIDALCRIIIHSFHLISGSDGSDEESHPPPKVTTPFAVKPEVRQ